MFSKFSAVCLFLVMSFVSVGSAFAEGEGVGITLPELPMADVTTAATAILAGLGVIWVLRKVIKLTNRS